MAAPRAPGGLLTRVVTGVLLGAVAIAAVWAGGLAFTALVMAAVLLMSAEWSVMHGVTRGFRLASLVALAFFALVTVRLSALDALAALGVTAAALGLVMRAIDRRRAIRVAAGLLYCGLPMVALLWLRSQPDGMSTTFIIFAAVSATDIGAFFVGRAVGGAKFVPSISPNKTWAGVVGGVAAAATTVALATVYLLGDFASGAAIGWSAAAGAVFGVVAILGDLLESWFKRRAGVKDSGNLLPGHGGVMDRIDGFVPVAVVAALWQAMATVR